MGLRLGRGGAAHVYGTWVWRVAKVVQLLSLSSSRLQPYRRGRETQRLESRLEENYLIASLSYFCDLVFLLSSSDPLAVSVESSGSCSWSFSTPTRAHLPGARSRAYML